MTGSLAESLHALAERFVSKTGRLQSSFDFSLDSGDALDQFIDLMLATGDPISDLVVLGMGAYLGETFIRNIGGSWVAMPKGPTPEDPGIEWKGLWVLPFEKVRKRIAVGSAHSIGFFLREMHDSAGLPAADRDGRWTRFRRPRER